MFPSNFEILPIYSNFQRSKVLIGSATREATCIKNPPAIYIYIYICIHIYIVKIVKNLQNKSFETLRIIYIFRVRISKFSKKFLTHLQKS